MGVEGGGPTTDLSGTRQELMALHERLSAPCSYGELRGIYLQLAPLLGRLDGALRSLHAEPTAADQALAQAKAAARQVGLDIRLASPQALHLGLQSAVDAALGVATALEGK